MNDENVVAGAFCDVALVVEQEAFVVAAVKRFDFGENIVQIIQRFDHRRERGNAHAARRHRDEFNAVGVYFRRIQFDGIRDDNHRRFGAVARAEPEVAHAARDDGADVAVGNAVASAGFDVRFRDFFAAPRQIERDGFCRIFDAFEVRVEFENAVVVNANAFEKPVAVEQTVVENRDFSVFFFVKLSVDVNFHKCAYGITRNAGTQKIFLSPERFYMETRDSEDECAENSGA